MAESAGNPVNEDNSGVGANNPASVGLGSMESVNPKEILCYLSQNLSLLVGGSGGYGHAAAPETHGNFSTLLSDLSPAGMMQKSAKHGLNDTNELLYCQTEWDDLICWPETIEGKKVTVPCFEEFNGIFYDTSRNATRYCMPGGNWSLSDYSECRVLNGSTGPSEGGHLAITTGVYFFGYCVSLCALVIATIIFLAFKELRCLRNIIHTHLMITYILADMLWIITSSTTFTGGGTGSGSAGSGVFDNQTGDKDADSASSGHTGTGMEMGSGSGSGQSNQVPCVTFILLHYFHLTNFFWMGVEGLYLYVLVVKTFVSENIKLRVYACIGWGVPLIIVIAWSIAKWITQSDSPDLQVTDPEFSASTCLWLPVNEYDWIYKTPVILVLSFNLIFLVQIMWVLITKLRSAMNPETQQSIKAAKALVVLMPLLGITYFLILSGSKAPTYEYLRALLISTQGFLVAFLYCFLNGEVRQAIRHRWNRLRMMGPVCCDFDRRRNQMHHMTRDWSPRSRTESIRYPSGPEHNLGKRESVVSATTSVTTIHSGGIGNTGSCGNGYGNSLLHREPASSPGVAKGPQTPLYQFHNQVPSTITDGGRGRSVRQPVVGIGGTSSSCTTSLLGNTIESTRNNHFAPKSNKRNGQQAGTTTSFLTGTNREHPSKMEYLQVPLSKY